MKRTEKFKNTKVFTYYNANPKNRITGDCTFRAFATALNQDYNQTVMEMAELMCKTGYALNDTKGEDAYLKLKGWTKYKQPRKYDNTKYTGEEFCLNYADTNKTYIAHIGGHHIVCIRDCRILDIWDSSDGSIGNYWVKED